MTKPYQISDWDGTTIESLREYLEDYVYKAKKGDLIYNFVFYITETQFKALQEHPVHITYYNEIPRESKDKLEFQWGMCRISFKLKTEYPKKKTGYGKPV